MRTFSKSQSPSTACAHDQRWREEPTRVFDINYLVWLVGVERYWSLPVELVNNKLEAGQECRESSERCTLCVGKGFGPGVCEGRDWCWGVLQWVGGCCVEGISGRDRDGGVLPYRGSRNRKFETSMALADERTRIEGVHRDLATCFPWWYTVWRCDGYRAMYNWGSAFG